VREEKIDLIFTTSPPPSLHLVGYFLKLLTGKPWVADFRDPWIGYKFETYPTFLHLFLKNQLIKLIIKNADRIISANPSITKTMMEQYSGAKKIETINQGYDERDLETSVSQKSELFTIGYLGTFSPDCNPEPVFLALRNLIDQKLIPKDKIRFIHVGLSMGIDLDGLVEKHDLKEVLEKKGYLSHRKALDQMKGVSVFLLVTSDNPLIFPAKVFEYLLFKKPILGIVPQESEVGKVILEMKWGRVVPPEDKNGIAETLLYYFSNFENKTFSFPRNEENVKKFDRRYLTSKLASIFDQIMGKGC
jgi:hypothetical protein